MHAASAVAACGHELRDAVAEGAVERAGQHLLRDGGGGRGGGEIVADDSPQVQVPPHLRLHHRTDLVFVLNNAPT